MALSTDEFELISVFAKPLRPCWAIEAHKKCWGAPAVALSSTGVPHLAVSFDEAGPILVRQDDPEQWEYIEKQRKRKNLRRGGLVIYGHPGIGARSSVRLCVHSY